MLPLEEAIFNLMELAAVEDTPPFLSLLRKRGGAPSGGGPSVERGAALHLGFASYRGEARVRTAVTTTDGRLQGLNRPSRGPGKSAEPGT